MWNDKYTRRTCPPKNKQYCRSCALDTCYLRNSLVLDICYFVVPFYCGSLRFSRSSTINQANSSWHETKRKKTREGAPSLALQTGSYRLSVLINAWNPRNSWILALVQHIGQQQHCSKFMKCCSVLQLSVNLINSIIYSGGGECVRINWYEI